MAGTAGTRTGSNDVTGEAGTAGTTGDCTEGDEGTMARRTLAREEEAGTTGT